jgi:capsular exopolysaccharide synthesis family protein
MADRDNRLPALSETGGQGLARPRQADYPNARFEEPAGSRGLLEYWHILRRRKFMVSAIALASALAGALAVLPQPVVYIGRTTVEVQGMNESFMNMNQVDPQAGTGSYLPTESNIQTQIQIIESNSLRQRASNRMGREMTPLTPPQSDRLNPIRARLRVIPEDAMEFSRDAIERCALTVKGAPLKGSRVIEIRCESTSPELAAGFLNNLASEYMDQTLEFRVKSAQRVGKWMVDRLEEAKTKLEQSENRLHAYVRADGVPLTEQKDTLADSKLRQLQGELSAIQADRIAKQTRLEMASDSPPESLSDVLDDANLRGYQAKITDLRRQLADLTTTLAPGNYKVKRVEAQIAEVESAMNKEIASIQQRIRNEYTAALQREKLLSSAHVVQSRVVAGQTARNLDHDLLKREVETNRQLYNVLLQQVNLAGVAAAAPATTVRVIDPATPPVRPSRPILWLYSLLGLMSGVIAGCGIAFVRERMDASVRQPGQTGLLVDVPELGVIPSSPHTGGRRLLGFRQKQESNGGGRLDLEAWQGKASLLADSYRAVLSSILFESVRGIRPRVIVVTSPGQREGKTTISANLATALAEVLGRVCLVDGDLRKPRVHEIFGLEAQSGLAEALRDTVPVEDYAMEQLARPTDIPRLFVLTSGVAGTGAGSLFFSPRMQQLMERLRREFDVVVVDTPPMLGLPDTRTLARVADGVILVVRAGVTDQSFVVAARRNLHDDNTPLLGTILNDWDPKSGFHGQYYSHSAAGGDGE